MSDCKKCKIHEQCTPEREKACKWWDNPENVKKPKENGIVAFVLKDDDEDEDKHIRH